MIDEGTVYLIHLDAPLAHARHYIGWASDVETGLKFHKKGKGARFLQVCNERGITYKIVRTWPGNKDFERLLKNRKNARRLCPICRKVH